MKRVIVSFVCMFSLLAQPASALAQLERAPVATPTPWATMKPWGLGAPPSSTSQAPAPSDNQSPNPDATADAERWFSRVHMGEPIQAAIARLGDPNAVAHQTGSDYLAYEIADGKGFLVVRATGYVVDGIQVTDVMHNYAPVRDAYGVALGDTASHAWELLTTHRQYRSLPRAFSAQGPILRGTARPQRSTFSTPIPLADFEARRPNGPVWRFAMRNGEVRFYVFDRSGRVDRLGVSRVATQLPALLRWYNRTGWAPSLAVPYSEETASEQGREKYVAALIGVAHYPCYGGNGWIIRSSKEIRTDDDDLLRVVAECGRTNYRMPVYFRVGAGGDRIKDLHLTPPVDRESAELIAENQPREPEVLPDPETAAIADIRDRGFVVPARPTAAPSPSPKPSVSPSPTPTPTSGYSIWFQVAPWGVYNVNPNGNSQVDLTFGSESPSTNPLVSFVLKEVPIPNLAPIAGSSRPRASARHDLSEMSSTLLGPCGSLSGGGGKCAASDTAVSGKAGPHCYQVSGTSEKKAINALSNIICLLITIEASYNPQDQQSNGGGNCHCGLAAEPVDMTSGALVYKYTDGAFSGPFGLTSARTYSSVRAEEQDILGIGWRTPYSIKLDLTNLSLGLVTLENASGGYSYYGAIAPGKSYYDNYSGDTFTENSNATFTLTKWDGETENFDINGRLSSLSDRIGNSQVIARNSSGAITSVTDPLGRSLTFATDSQGRITSVSHSTAGLVATLTYDSGTNCYTGDLCSVKEADGSLWTYEYYSPTTYGENHLLMAVVDPNGNIEEQNQYSQVNISNGSAYDNHYRVSQQQRQGGSETHNFTYQGGGIDLNGQAYSTDPGFNSWDMGYTTDTDGLGRATYYGWDGVTQQVTLVWGVPTRGAQYYFLHDWFGRPTTFRIGPSTTAIDYSYGRDNLVTNPDGSTYIQVGVRGPTEIDMPNASGGTLTVTKKYQYYPTGDSREDLPNQESEISVGASGGTATTTFTYSSNGLLTQLTRQGFVSGSPSTITESFGYDSRGRIQAIVGPRTDVNQTTRFAYFSDGDGDLNRRGQLSSVTDPLGHVTTFAAASTYSSYDPFGSSESVIDPNGVTVDNSYDTRGRLTSTTLVGIGSTGLSYTKLGRPLQVTEPLGNSAQFGYTPQEKLQSLTLADASGLQHERDFFGYNAMDEVTSDAFGECSAPVPACSSWTTGYSQSFSLNSYGAIASMSDGAGVTRSYQYNNGLVSTDTFGSGSDSLERSLSYDPLGALNQYQSPAGFGGTGGTLSRDAQYNLSQLSFNVDSEAYTHDDFGHLIQRVSNYAGTTTYQYNAAGDPTSVAYSDGSSVIAAYDALDRVTTATYSKSGAPTETVTYTYDDPTSGHYAIGRLSKVTDPSGQTTLTYEPHGLLATKSQIVNGFTYNYRYAYDANARLTTLALASGLSAGYSYDWADRPVSVSNGGTTVASAATYAPFGPMTALQYANGVTQTWTYDQGYRLSHAVVSNGTSSLSDLSYVRDDAGLVTSITDNLNANFSQTLTYSQLAFTSDNSGTGLWGAGSMQPQAGYLGYANYFLGNSPADQLRFTYNAGSAIPALIGDNNRNYRSVTTDPRGNVTLIGTSAFTYSARNLLSSGEGISYQYDAFGRRVLATNPSTGTIASLYVGGHLAEESGLSGSGPQYDYLWLGDKAVAQVSGGTTYYYAENHLDAPYMLTNASGQVAWQADYTPLGSILTIRTADVHQPLRLPGQEAEEFALGAPNGATSLYYNGARWYLPTLGFYTQPDPLQQGANEYQYAALDAANFVDPSGTNAAAAALYLSEAAEASPGDAVPLVDIAVGALQVGLVGLAIAAAFDPSGDSSAVTSPLTEATNEIRETATPCNPPPPPPSPCGPNSNPTGSSTNWNAANGPGPLTEQDANNFTGSSFTETVLDQPLTLYRGWGGSADQFGPWWTTTPPAGPLQQELDGGVLPEWGNTFENTSSIEVPAGTTVYHGTAASQSGDLSSFLGGGSQVYVPNVDPSWLCK